MNTKEKLIQEAITMAKTYGMEAVTFQRLAEKVGIKKPSIVYHFPSKVALVEAMLAAYTAALFSQLEKTAPADSSAKEALLRYIDCYAQLNEEIHSICFGGVLSGVYEDLPTDTQQAVTDFMASHIQWLSAAIKSGQQSGEFRLDRKPTEMATLFLSTLQGGLLIKRALKQQKLIGELAELLLSTLNQSA